VLSPPPLAYALRPSGLNETPTNSDVGAAYGRVGDAAAGDVDHLQGLRPLAVVADQQRAPVGRERLTEGQVAQLGLTTDGGDVVSGRGDGRAVTARADRVERTRAECRGCTEQAERGADAGAAQQGA